VDVTDRPKKKSHLSIPLGHKGGRGKLLGSTWGLAVVQTKPKTGKELPGKEATMVLGTNNPWWVGKKNWRNIPKKPVKRRGGRSGKEK